MTPEDAPADCWTCQHRRATPYYSYSPYVCVVWQECAEFVRSDRNGNSANLTCLYAYDTFCGGGDWKPTLSARIGMWLGKKR